jgi:N-methylhydantoinase A
MDLRYEGEAYEITTPLSGTELSPDRIADTAERFHELHEERYAYKRPDDPIELVSLRTTLIKDTATPEYAATLDDDPIRTERECYFDETGFVDVPVYNRKAVDEAGTVTGPLVVEEPTSTTVVFPGQTVQVDDRVNLVITTE